MAFFEGTILTSPADGIAPSLLLSCGSHQCLSRAQYIFNLPESLDRLASDQKIRLNSVRAIFTPEVTTEAMGGLGSRLFACAKTTRSCAIIAPVGFQEWLGGVRLISRRLGDLQLDHYVVRQDNKVCCYTDSFIDVAAITRNCKAKSLPGWLRPDPRLSAAEKQAADKQKETKRSRKEEENVKVVEVKKEEEECKDEDEVIFVKEIGTEEKDDDNLPEVICIDLASNDGDDDGNETEREEQAAKESPSGEEEGSDEGYYSSSSSSDASFIPLFKHEPAHRPGRTGNNSIPIGIVAKQVSDQGDAGPSDHQGRSAPGNCQDVKKEHEGDGATGVYAKGRKKLKWCRSGKSKRKKKHGKARLKRFVRRKDEEMKRRRNGGPDIVTCQLNEPKKLEVPEAPKSPKAPKAIKAPDAPKEEPACSSPCSSPPTPPVKSKTNFDNPEEICISSSDCEDESQTCTGRKKRRANNDCKNHQKKKKPKLAKEHPEFFNPIQQPGLQGMPSGSGSNQFFPPVNGLLGHGAQPQRYHMRPPNPVGMPPHMGGAIQQNVQSPWQVGPMHNGAWRLHGLVPPPPPPPPPLPPPPPPNSWISPSCGTLKMPPFIAFPRRGQENHRNSGMQNPKQNQNHQEVLDDEVGKNNIHMVEGTCRSAEPKEKRDSDPIVAYIVKLKSTNQLVMVVFAKQPNDVVQLKSHAAWETATKQKSRIDVVFHLSEMDVIEGEAYRSWMRGLPGKQVVVTSKPVDPSLSIGLRHVLDRGVRLNLVAPNIFPIPKLLMESQKYKSPSLPSNCTPAWILTSVKCTRERNGLELMPSSQPRVDLDAFRKEVLNVNVKLVREIEALSKIGLINWSKCSEFYSTALNHPTCFMSVQPFLTSSPEINSSGAFEYASSIARHGFPPCMPKLLSSGSQTGVFFFGTGCSEPSAWRGGSAILLRIEEYGSAMMIDVGEGTYGQMVRYFGEQEAREIVDSIECIWISHQHGDHCLGVASLIKQRSENTKPVLVLAPRIVVEHLCCARKAFGLNAELVDIKQQAQADRVLESQKLMGLDTFLSIEVDHSCEAYGLVLVHVDGWKLVFSGDTRPCTLLRQAGRNCTLLIHEATHAPEEQTEATTRRHSTWSEALEEGYQMNAYRTILTHFSRRYPNLPTGLTPEELGGSGSIAFDGMNVPFGLLPFLPRLNPAVHEALHEIEEGGEIDMSDDESDSN